MWKDFIFPSTLRVYPYVRLLIKDNENLKNINLIELGLNEALINAVVHGNKIKKNKFLKVKKFITRNWVIWQICDSGDGFVHSSKNIHLPVDIDSDHGRGIYLINKCFDNVRWNKKGNCIQLATKIK